MREKEETYLSFAI